MTDNLLRKVHKRGGKWFLRRCAEEVRTPTSRLGHRIRPLLTSVWRTLESIQGSLARTVLGGVADARDTLFLFYDLETNPVTYDFAWSLCAAEVERVKAGLKKVHVVFVPGSRWDEGRESAEYFSIVNAESREWRFSHILVPLCALLPSVSGHSLCSSRRHGALYRSLCARHSFPVSYSPRLPHYHQGPSSVFRAHDEGLSVQSLKACAQGMEYMRQWEETHAGGCRIITITLRESDYMPARNSSRDAWISFADSLDRTKYLALIVPDTDRAMAQKAEDFGGHSVFFEGAWDVRLRMALYERAWLNLSVNSGPFVTSFLNENTRSILFKAVVPSVPQATEDLLRGLGFPVGRQLPFASPFQRILWKESDELETIVREFHRMEALIENEERESLAGPSSADGAPGLQ